MMLIISMAMHTTSSALDYADIKRLSIKLPKKQHLEQYFSSAPLSRLMASMMDYQQKEIRILDPGAGVGSLFAACVEAACKMDRRPHSIAVTAYEIDTTLSEALNDSLERIRKICRRRGVKFSGRLVKKNFITDYSRDEAAGSFTHVIMNPPYKKISVASPTYEALRHVGIQTTNMYTAFIAIAQRMLVDGGQLVFISPRSFCNGSYFDRFRKHFLESMSFRRIHLFNSRTSLFHDDGVLQENVIIHAEKHGRRKTLIISSSGGSQEPIKQRRVGVSEVIFDEDPQHFIHIVPDAAGSRVSSMIRGLECTLEDLDIDVSTGRVVDFRIKDELSLSGVDGAVPLVRPFNISGGTVLFPLEGRKHRNFIMESAKSRRLLVENGNYVLVKRFTTVEEKRRVVAAVWAKEQYRTSLVGFENRTNYYHRRGHGLDLQTARGLWMFLNSTVVDSYFRQFNGTTQVNATDLRYIRYPSEDRLERLGGMMTDVYPDQKRLDEIVEGLLYGKVTN